MSADWTVIGLDEPGPRLLVEALARTMPELSIRQDAADQVWEIVDDAGTALLAVEPPRRIQLPGEILRLLDGAPYTAPDGQVPALFAPGGVGDRRDPLWWQDLHAVGADSRAAALADRLATTVALLITGIVVPPRTAASGTGNPDG